MKILLAMDGSEASEAALEHVASRPWAAGSSFEVISVVEPSHSWTSGATSEIVQAVAQRADDLVTQAAMHLRSKNYEASGLTQFGKPAAAIVERAKKTDADFVVVGSHGMSGLKRFLLGSVAGSVLRGAPCSVEIVRSAQGGAIKKVLLATDGSEFSEHAARSIADRPWPAGTEFRVLSVVEMNLPNAHALLDPPNLHTAFLESQRGEAMKRAEEAVDRAQAILAAAGFDSSESISVLLDPPRTIILNEAAEWGADLIALGSHGENRLDRLLVGSVSESVAMHATCSVDVVRKR